MKREDRCNSGAIPVAVKGLPNPERGMREASIFATVRQREGIEVNPKPEDLPGQSTTFNAFGRKAEM